MRKLLAALTLALAVALPALAQNLPMPPNSVFGNIGTASRPGYAVPLTSLQVSLSGGETDVSDANYALLAADRNVIYTTLTASRTVTLLPAAAYLPGTIITIMDRSGSASPTITLSIAPTGSDTINGANATTKVIAGPYGTTTLESDGFNKWTVRQPPTLGLPNTWLGDQYFASGRPWCDVRAKGAKGDGATDDSAAFKACRVALDALGGGTMYVPPGNYCLKTADANNAAISISASPITVMGAGINVSNLWTCGSDISIGYANIVGAGFLNLSYLGKGGQGNPSDTTFGATKPAFKLDTSCGICRIDFVRGFGGLYAVDDLGFDSWISNFSFGYTYGNAIFHDAGNGHRIAQGALDQNWPVVLPNQNSLTISAWQSTHSYSGNGAANTNVVSTQGYNIQLVDASCTSGGSAPTLQNYGTAITDGTCHWQLVGNTTYYGFQCDGNCAELTLHGGVDLNCGGCTENFAMVLTNGGTAPNLVVIDGSSLGQAIVSQIFLHDGTGFTLLNSHLATSVQTSAAGLNVGPNSFTGGASISGNRFSGAGACIGIGLAPSGISGYSITGNRFDSCTIAINFFAAAAAAHITAGHNTMVGVTTAFTVPSGSSFYEFVNNDINGAAVSFTAGDANKIVAGNDGSSYPSLPCTTTALSLQYNASGSFGCVAGATSNGTSITFANSDLLLLGSSTGATTFTSDNAGASNFTAHVPAANDTLAMIAAAQTLTNKTINCSNNTCSNVPVNSATGTLAIGNGGTNATTVSGIQANVLQGFVITTPISVNFNVAGDNAIPITLASGFTQFRFFGVVISQCSASITTATFQMWTATGGTGAAIVGTTTPTVANNTANTNNNFQLTTGNNVSTEAYTPSSGNIQFRVGTTVAATCSVSAMYSPVP